MRARTLMYHDLSDMPSGFDDPWAHAYKVSEAEFKAHLNAIDEAGFSDRVLPVEGAWKDDAVFLTFDDGGASAARIAEILSARRWCGHFFVTTGRIGQQRFLNPGQIRGIHAGGHIVGSHSVNHPTRMRALGRADLEREWRESVDALQQILGSAVRTASVPGGFYSRAVGETASEAGIRRLFNSEPTEAVDSVDSCLIIGRYYIQNTTSAEEAAGFAGGDWRVCGKQRLYWKSRKVLKALFGSGYVAIGRQLRRTTRR